MVTIFILIACRVSAITAPYRVTHNNDIIEFCIVFLFGVYLRVVIIMCYQYSFVFIVLLELSNSQHFLLLSFFLFHFFLLLYFILLLKSYVPIDKAKWWHFMIDILLFITLSAYLCAQQPNDRDKRMK